VDVSTSDSVDVGAGVSQTLPAGTSVAVSVTGQRSLRHTPIAPAGELRSGPAYGVSAELDVVQPLLRGAGTDVGLAELRSAQRDVTTSRLAARQTASDLLAQLLSSYWELWYADRALAIDQAARDLSRVQEKEAGERVATGALAPIEQLSFTTDLAQLEEAVVAAATEREQRAIALGQLLGVPATGEDLLPSEDPALDTGTPVDPAKTLAEAERASYEIQRLKVEIAQGKDQAAIAGDSLRPRLDLSASVRADGLGNRQVAPAFDQIGGLRAVSAGVGLTFEMPLSDARRQAQQADALLSVHISEQRLASFRQELRAELLSSIAARSAADQRLSLAERTAELAERQAQAERERLATGSSIAIEVQQADNALRQARLRVERARVDLVLADLRLRQLRGALLPSYVGAVADLSSRTRGVLGSLIPGPGPEARVSTADDPGARR
jgi:outer membrane protein